MLVTTVTALSLSTVAIALSGSTNVNQTFDNISYTTPYVAISSESFAFDSESYVSDLKSKTKLFADTFHTKTKYDEISGELLSYMSLENDWDGYGGSVPKKETILSCSELLSKLCKKNITPPKTMLSGDGEVSLYWTNKTMDIHIEIGFEEEGLYSYLISTPSLTTGEDDYVLSNDIPTLLLEHISAFNLHNEKMVA